MRKVFIWGLVFAFIMAIPQFINSAEATDVWKTYKLIKDGELNTAKWETRIHNADDGQPAVQWSIEGDKVKFEHRDGPGTAGVSDWLWLIKRPECVKGIQVEITMGTEDDPDNIQLSGNFRARVGNCVGAWGDSGDYAWSQLAIRNREEVDGGDRVFGALSLLESDTLALLVDPIYNQFYNPEEVDGSTYLVTMIVDREKRTVEYKVDGFGFTTYEMPENVVPGFETQWSIGTRTYSEDHNSTAKGTAWFGNNVKVLVDDECVPDKDRPVINKTWPEDNERKVDVGIDEVKLQFNEGMHRWDRGCEEESCCPRLEWKDPSIGQYVLVTYACNFEYDPTKEFVLKKGEGDPDLIPNSWYRVVVPSNFFMDLAGNGNIRYAFKFKTGNPSP